MGFSIPQNPFLCVCVPQKKETSGIDLTHHIELNTDENKAVRDRLTVITMARTV